MNNEVIRWGFIGCGEVTEVKSGPAYQKTDNFEVKAVMRRSGELAKDYAQRHNIQKYYDCANKLINDAEIDAVYIATPPDTHKKYALEVAKAGKICCIEKPLAPSFEECKEIVESFEKEDIPLFVAYYRRSLPRFNEVKRILDEGEIGKIRQIAWHLSKPANHLDLSQQYNWRTDKKIALGGYFDDLASHGLDLFSYLLGEYKTVSGVATNQQGLYSAFDSVSACWVHKNGVTGVGSWNFGCSSRKDEVTIFGESGEVSFSVFDERPIVVNSNKQLREVAVENPENVQLFHVKNMRDELIDGTIHPSIGRSALHTAWVMENILQ